MITAELSSPRYDLATLPDSALAESRICSMFSSRVSIGVLPGRVSYPRPFLPNFFNSRSTLKLARSLISEISLIAARGKSSSSIPVVNPRDVQIAIVIFVIRFRNSAPRLVP